MGTLTDHSVPWDTGRGFSGLPSGSSQSCSLSSLWSCPPPISQEPPRSTGRWLGKQSGSVCRPSQTRSPSSKSPGLRTPKGPGEISTPKPNLWSRKSGWCFPLRGEGRAWGAGAKPRVGGLCFSTWVLVTGCNCFVIIYPAVYLGLLRVTLF